MQPPILETERLILRPLKITDAEAHYRYFNDYEVTRYLASSLPWPYPVGGSEHFISKVLAPDQQNYYWAITKKDRGALSDEFIGVIELRPNDEEGQRGFWLARDFHNQGIMTEAAMVTTDFWFDVLKKPRLHLSNAQTNEASRRIKEKTGARFIELVPSSFVDPALTHSEHWEISAEDWKAFRHK